MEAEVKKLLDSRTMPAILLLIALLAAGQIETGEACRQKVDLCFVLDGSSTVCGGDEKCENWEYALKFSKKISAALDIGPTLDQVALVTLNNKTKKQWDLEKYRAKKPLLSAIKQVPYKGGEFYDKKSVFILGTKIFNQTTGDNPDHRNLAIMITDGIPIINETAATALTTKLFEKYNITVFTVCVLPGCTKSWAEAAASKPEKPGLKTYFLVESYSELLSVKDEVMENICYFLEDELTSTPPEELSTTATVG